MIPIEDANESNRHRIESNVLPRLNECIQTLEEFRRLKDVHEIRVGAFKREGDARVAEVKQAWKSMCKSLLRPIFEVEDALRSTRNVARSLEEAAGDAHLNRLVGKYEEIVRRAEEAIKKSAAYRCIYIESLPNRDPLQTLSQWMPGWDVKVKGADVGAKGDFVICVGVYE